MRLLTGLVLGFVILICCLGVAGCAVAPQAHASLPQAPAPTALKAMSFNIRYGTAMDGDNAWPRRHQRVLQVLRHEAPDLIGLQEALKFQVDEIAAALPGYGVIFAGRDDGDTRGEACAILYSRLRFELESSGTFWLSDTPDVPSNTWKAACLRICTWARLRDRVTGRVLNHYNVHLDHMSENAREQGIRLVLSRIRSASTTDPVIVTGDFNDGERSTTVKLAGTHLVETFRSVHPLHDHHGVGTFNGFKNKTDGEKIDYILVTPGVEVVTAEIVRTTIDGHNISDHFPVTATLRF